MKKILLAIAFIMAMSFGANAQRDGFFNDWEDIGNGLDRTGIEMPTLPYQHGLLEDPSAPLGSGLIILGALGAGYAVARRKREE